jgi:hypothetical protein
MRDACDCAGDWFSDSPSGGAGEEYLASVCSVWGLQEQVASFALYMLLRLNHTNRMVAPAFRAAATLAAEAQKLS